MLKRMVTRVIAETGAGGQHGVATATSASRPGVRGLATGSEDVKRQSPNAGTA
jgi:tryptophan synthase beta subunit